MGSLEPEYDGIAMIKYEQLIKKHGLYRVNQLSSPNFKLFTDIELPTNSIIHFIPDTEAQTGPRSDDPMLNGLYDSKNIVIEHLTKYSRVVGNHKKMPDISARAIAKYQRSNRMIRPLRRLETTLRNRNVVLIVNYGTIISQYRFTRSIFSDMWKWQSTLNTLIDSTDKYATLCDRPQFIRIGLPTSMTDYDTLKRASKNITRKSLESLKYNDFWMIALFNLFDDDISDEYQYLNKIDPKILCTLNIYWMVDTKVVIMPLSTLMELKAVRKEAGQRVLIDFLEAMVDHRSVGEDGDESDEIADLPVVDETTKTLDSEIKHQAELMAEKGHVSAAEYKRLIKLSERHTTLDNPFGEGKLVDLVKTAAKHSSTISTPKLTNLDTTIDRSMETSSLKHFDNDYVTNVMQADIAAMVLATQNAGVAVTNYKVSEVLDAAGSYRNYSVQLTPIVGKPSTIHFQLPIVEEDGVFTAGGVRSRLDKQRSDMPIRKVSSSRVALTSYFGKVFIDRDERSVYNYARWVTNSLIKLEASNEEPLIRITLDDVFDPESDTPRVYSAIATRIARIEYNGYTLVFDYKQRTSHLPGIDFKTIESKGMVVCGKKGASVITVDENNTFYSISGNKTTVIGDIDAIMDGRLGVGPVEIITIKIFGSNIALGVLLAYRHGLTKLLNLLSAKFRRVTKGTRATLDSSEYRLVFEDETLILDRDDRKTAMVIGGFNQFKNAIKNIAIGEFDKPEIYLNVLESQGFALRHLKEIDLMYQMFIDPITLEILTDIKEPTTFNGLLLRSVELLMTDQHPRETDMAFMRIRGYERMSGLVYSELIKSLRTYHTKPKNAESQIEMNPRAVWMGVSTDTSAMLVEELNPINNLKEKERVSYSGLGGRDAQTMVKRTREFHPNDQGVISEATLDSGKAGATTYLTADPNFTSLRGVARKLDKKEDGTAKQVSTTFLLLPCTDREDQQILKNG